MVMCDYRVNVLNQPKVYPSIETAQQRHYSERDREKIEKINVE